jgi:hypothetical protein
MSDGAGGSPSVTRMARDYQEREQRKGLRWFVSVGDEIPTQVDIDREVALRQAELDTRHAAAREVLRLQDVTAFAKHAFVAADRHPGFSMAAANVAEETPASFGVAAAETVEVKKQLHKTFTSALWMMLARMRAERRLNRMASALDARQAGAEGRGRDAVAGGGKERSMSKESLTSVAKAGAHDRSPSMGRELARSVYNLGVRNIALLTLPALPPSSTDQMQASSSTGASAAALLAEEPPTGADAEVFLEKELKVPFEFKLKHYSRFKFTDHHFATCDPADVPPNFPAGIAEATEANADATVPKLQHFTQPTVTLETFPLFEFPFQRTLPHQGLVKGVDKQPVSNGGFRDPELHLDYGHAVPSFALPRDEVCRLLVAAPLPTILKAPDRADDVSDEEGEDDFELPKPSSLLAVAASLPSFAALPASAGAGADTSSSTGRGRKKSNASCLGVGDVSGENFLGFEERPVHGTGRQLVNRPVADALTVSAANLDALAAHLLPTMRIVF